MARLCKVIIAFLCLFVFIQGNVTKRSNKLLDRRRRYLTFPQGSSFIITLSLIKSIMVREPRGHLFLGECDVPFTLPSDTRLFRNYKRYHMRQRREIFNQISLAIDGYGFNGNACVKRMICDAQAYVPLKGESLLKDLLSAAFMLEDGDELEDYLNYCDNSTYAECDLPLLHFLESFTVADIDTHTTF